MKTFKAIKPTGETVYLNAVSELYAKRYCVNYLHFIPTNLSEA